MTVVSDVSQNGFNYTQMGLDTFPSSLLCCRQLCRSQCFSADSQVHFITKAAYLYFLLKKSLWECHCSDKIYLFSLDVGVIHLVVNGSNKISRSSSFFIFPTMGHR